MQQMCEVCVCLNVAAQEYYNLSEIVLFSSRPSPVLIFALNILK